MVCAGTSAMSCAARIAPAWPCTLGAVKPILSAPSLLAAVPLMTAWMVSPSRSASASRRSTTMPAPLPITVPAARASKARQWPSGERMAPFW
ncbi:hypothetical protein D3C72_1382670 [compost metagenome]